jgi:hypothetical protein
MSRSAAQPSSDYSFTLRRFKWITRRHSICTAAKMVVQYKTNVITEWGRRFIGTGNSRIADLKSSLASVTSHLI